MNESSYSLQIAGPAARALAEALPPKIAAAAYSFITGPLLENPQRVGKQLQPPLAPTWSAHRGEYRVLYLIDETSHAVKVTAIRHRSDAYRD